MWADDGSLAQARMLVVGCHHGAGPGQVFDIGRVEVTQTDRFFNNNQQWSFLLSNHGAVHWIGLDWLDRTFTQLITLTSSPCGLSKLFWPLIRRGRVAKAEVLCHA
jgi:hypothetical protein